MFKVCPVSTQNVSNPLQPDGDEVVDLRVSTDHKLIAHDLAKSKESECALNADGAVNEDGGQCPKEAAKGLFDEMVGGVDDAEDTIFGQKSRRSEDALHSETASKPVVESAVSAPTESVKPNEDPLSSSALPSLNVSDETVHSESDHLCDDEEGPMDKLQKKKKKKSSGFFEGAESVIDIFEDDDDDGDGGEDIFGISTQRKSRKKVSKQDIKSLFDSDDDEEAAALFGFKKGAEDDDTVNID